MDDILADQAAGLLQKHARGDLDTDAIVRELASTDPTLGLLAGLLSRQPGQPEADAATTDLQTQLESAMSMADEARRLADGIRAEFDSLVPEMSELRNRMDELAAALGACPGWWGEEPSCGWCRGRGAPGALLPDPDAFTRLVLPALHRRADVRRQAQPGESISYD